MPNIGATTYNAWTSRTETTETKGTSNQQFAKEMEKYANFVKDRIENGEPAYQIGGKAYTEREWNKLLKDFDSAEEIIKKAIEEEQEEQEEQDKV